MALKGIDDSVKDMCRAQKALHTRSNETLGLFNSHSRSESIPESPGPVQGDKS